MPAPTTASRQNRDDGFGRTSRFYDINGKKLPSVTTILQAVNKPVLVNWAAKTERELVLKAAGDLYEDLPNTPKRMTKLAYMTTLESRVGKLKAHTRQMEKARNIGIAVHELIEWNIRKELLQAVGPEPKVPPEGMWAFMAYEDWRKTANLSPIMVEQVVFSERYGYAGTADLMCEINHPGLFQAQIPRVHVVTDWKTGKGIYLEALLQNAAYVHAAIEMKHATPGTAGLIVRLPKTENDPGFETRFIPAEDQKPLFKIFLAVLELWKWMDAEDQKYKAKAARG